MKKIPEEDLLAEIDRLADGDDPPSAIDMREEGQYSDVTYQNRFGSWEAALEAAGFEPTGMIYSEEKLLADLREMGQELGRPPSSGEMRTEGPHSAKTYQRRFGSWAGALDAAGFDLRRGRGPD